MDKYKVADLGGGIGAMAKAFIDEDFKLVFAAGRDKQQFELYEKYTGHSVDISWEPGSYNYLDIPENRLVEADVIVSRIFQTFSRASAHKAKELGNGRGRGQWDYVEKYIMQCQPKAFLLEFNVGFFSNICAEWFFDLSKGYNISYRSLPFREYTGLPLRQMRVYVVGIRNELECPKFQFPEEVKLSVGWKDIFQLDKKAKDVYYRDQYQKLADSLEIGKLYKVSKEECRECDTYPAGMFDQPVLRDYHGVRGVTNNEAALLKGLTGFDFDEELPRRSVFRWINASENEYMFRRLARRLRLCLNHQENEVSDWDERMIWNKLHWMNEMSPVQPGMIKKEEMVDIAETGETAEEITAEEIKAEKIVAEKIAAEEIVAEEIEAEEITAEEITEEEIEAEEITEEENTAKGIEAEKIESLETMQSKSSSCDSSNTVPQDDFHFPEAMKNISVFLSYCQKDDSLADSIDDHFRKRRLKLKRDKREIRAWRSIRHFMESIRDQDFVIMVITDNYLKSHNCMFEVLQVMQDRRYCERIFPLVIAGGIYEPEMRIDYIRFWEEKCRLLEEKLSGISLENSVEGAEDLRKYKQIATTIAQFMKILSDMNNPPQDDYNQAVEAELRRYIQSRRL